MWAIRLSEKAPRTQEEAETFRQRAETLSQKVLLAVLPVLATASCLHLPMVSCGFVDSAVRSVERNNRSCLRGPRKVRRGG